MRGNWSIRYLIAGAISWRGGGVQELEQCQPLPSISGSQDMGEIKDPNLTTFCMTLGNRFNHPEYQFYHKIKTILILSRVFLGY